MLFIKRHWSAILMILVFLAVNLIVLQWSKSSQINTKSNTLLKYGDSLPKLLGHSLAGNKTVEIPRGQTNLIIYLSSSQKLDHSIELAKYAELLWRSYGPRGLGVAAIVQGEIPEIENLISHSLINYDVISDADLQLSRKLGIDPAATGVFLFDSKGACRFSTRYPIKAEDMRQLVSVEFLHTDPFKNGAINQEAVEEGKPIGSWSLVDVRSWQQVSLDEIKENGTNLFVFFTAECSVCSLPDYLRKFAKFQNEQQSLGKQAKDAVLIFDFNFSTTDVLEQLGSHNITSPAYISNEELNAVAEFRQPQSLDGISVIAVQTDEQGAVLKISSLEALSEKSRPSLLPTGRTPPVSPQGTQAVYKKVFGNVALAAYGVATHGDKYYVSDVKRRV